MAASSPLRVLITGGSIAAFSTAWWLRNELGDGVDVTIVEKSPSFRTGGQNVDVRSTGRTIMKRMNLDDRALKLNTGERGIEFVDGKSKRVGLFAQEGGQDSFTAEMEILRGDLAGLLYDGCKEQAGDANFRIRFDTSVEHVEDGDDKVTVTFANDKATHDFDLLVVAEGVGSHTRDLVFPGKNEPRHINLITTFFTMARDDELDGGRNARIYHSPGGRTILVRPDAEGNTRASLMLYDDTLRDVHKRPADEQRAFFREKFADAGWQAARVLDGLDEAKDMYVDTLRQVKMPVWYSGKRVVLTGDSAWCVTPLGGIGASLSLIGSYVLANEVASQLRALGKEGAQDTLTPLHAALTGYEKVMRPIIEERQKIPQFVVRLAHPQTAWGVFNLRLVVRILSSSPVQWVAGLFSGGGGGGNKEEKERKEFPIPDYSSLKQSK